jgi:hypothetical protein
MVLGARMALCPPQPGRAGSVQDRLGPREPARGRSAQGRLVLPEASATSDCDREGYNPSN